jgi:quinol monooxygenase YgiN
VLVTSFTCHVKPEKEAELQVSFGNLMDRTRALPGCLACRLVAATEDPRAFTLIHEWSDRGALHRFLESAEYRVLKGMRFLMDQEPRLAVDEVVTRASIPLGPRDV